MVEAAFVTQIVLAVAGFVLGPVIARAPKWVWAPVAGLALGAMLLWPLMRVFPVQPIAWLGAPCVACVELTGLAVPAVLFFRIAAGHVPKKTDARALLLLNLVAGIYFIKAGWWMMAPGVPDLGETRIDSRGVCRQTTEYTCAAASMVTLLRTRGIDATETEMARLAWTQVNGGATDSRTLWALETKLAGTGLVPRYHKLDAAGLIAASKPCLVQMDWGFFVSHMVPVMEADEEHVVIGDPIDGRRRMSTEAFVARWKGRAITVEAE